MATVRQSFSFFHSRSCTFSNWVNKDPKNSMVVNSVNKTRNEAYPFKISSSESSKMETRKILTQEITLTSKGMYM